MIRKALPILIIFLFALSLMSCSGENQINPIMPSGDNQSSSRKVSVKTVVDSFWNTSVMVDSENWTAHMDDYGRITRALGRGITVGGPLDFIDTHPELFGVASSELILKRDEVHDSMRIAIYRQGYNGIEIENSLVRIIYGRGGKLVSYGSDTWSGYTASAGWAIDASTAFDLTEYEDETKFIASEKFYYAKEGVLIPAWRIDRDNTSFLVDASNGDILESHPNRFGWNHDGHITGDIKPFSPLDEDVETDMYGVRVDFYSYDHYYSGRVYTNMMGVFNFDNANRTRARNLTFKNPWINVKPAWDSGATAFDYWDWHNASDYSETLIDDSVSLSAERNVFLYSTISHDWFWSVEPDFDLLNFQLPAFVDKYGKCTAYAYVHSNPSIHFFQPWDNCTNTGDSPTIVEHEYGHIYVSKIYIGYPGSSLHEACADTLGNRVSQQHVIGPDLYGPDTYRRVSDNQRHWPAPECDGECHCVGNVLAGANWNLFENIGDELTNHIWHFSNYFNTTNFLEKGADYILIDDDDDDITNGCPHYDEIYDAFWTKHSLDVPEITNPQTEGVVIDIVPYNLPNYVRYADGGTFNYHLKIENLNDTQVETQIWASFQMPDESYYGPVIPPGYLIANPIDFTLEPHEIMNFDLTQWIPAYIQPNTYLYHVRVGEFVDHVNDILEDEGILEVTVWN